MGKLKNQIKPNQLNLLIWLLSFFFKYIIEIFYLYLEIKKIKNYSFGSLFLMKKTSLHGTEPRVSIALKINSNSRFFLGF